MENKFPKNVRQIGNVSDTPKIYVEDYVDTFLNQICDKADKEQAGAFLVGKKEVTEGQECLYIFGAICMEFSGDENEIISQENFEKAEQEKKEYFEDGTMIGWMLCRPGTRMVIDTKIFNTHEKYFSERNTIFILKDNAEVEEQYYCYKYKELMQIGGHYVYYEKNEPMQNFLIEQNKYARERSEKVADEAVKTFRKKVEEKTKGKKRDKIAPLFRMASASAAAAMLIAGVLYLNQYEKLKKTNSISDKAKIEKKKSETVVSNSNNDAETIEKSETSDTEKLKEETQTGTESDSVSGSMDGKRDKKSEQANAGAEGNKQSESARQEQQGETGSDRTESANTAQSTGNTSIAQTTGSNSMHETYTVREGDTITSISRAYYGTTSKIKEICELNGISAEEFIFPGQKILLP